MNSIKLSDYVGSFAENKEKARDLRIKLIIPALEGGQSIVLDFDGIDAATQSFIHALLSDVFRKYGTDVLDQIMFKNCNETLQKIISIVSDYMQEAD